MRVAILHDHPHWAQAAHSQGLKKYAPKDFEVRTWLLGQEFGQVDAVYCINFGSVRQFGSMRSVTCCASHAWMYPVNDPADWRTRGVNPRRNSVVGRAFLRKADAVICRNRELEAWALETHRRVACIPAGIDPEIWHPAGRGRAGQKLRVGFCGQVNPEVSGQFKGFSCIWTPLKERLGDRYEFVENTRTANEALSWSELAEWMRSLDVFICCASAEGTPNTIFQAAACGAVVMSTRVGQVADWRDVDPLIVPTYRNAVEAEATIQAITEKLSGLEDPASLKTAQAFVLDSVVRNYSYRVLAPKTLAFICGVQL